MKESIALRSNPPALWSVAYAVLFILALCGGASTAAPPAEAPAPPAEAPAPPAEVAAPPTEPPADNAGPSLVDKWGVEIQGIRLTSAGYMLDFRYKVIDPEKAKPLLNRNNKWQLTDQASGAKFTVPVSAKTGAFRQSTFWPKAGKVYFVFFANPGKYIKAGNLVTVVIGDFKAEGLVVQ